MSDKPEKKPRGIGYKITNNPREDFPNHIWEIDYGHHVSNWETDRLLDFIDAIPPEILKRADLAKPSESPMDDIGPCNFVLDCSRASEACSYLLLEHPRCFKPLPSPPDKE